MVGRTIQAQVENDFFQKKTIIIYGARQVGKTTLIKNIQKKYPEISLYVNCDEPDLRRKLSDITSTGLREFVGDKQVVFIDEAQRVKNIGITLKLFVDNFPDKQLVATGSSSLELSNEISEPLTGRKYEFHLYSFSLNELTQIYTNVELDRTLENRLLYGMYPDIVNHPDRAELLLRELAKSYLYKDIFEYQDIRKPEIIEKLLVALALQIGNEVSYTELASLLKIRKETVLNYVQLLEKAFVIFRISPFSRNLKNELKKLRKIYFYDTGIRNALINNFNTLEMRNDKGNLWENFLISERIKSNSNHRRWMNTYFWRTHTKQEIDYIEEKDGVIAAYEFKWAGIKKTIPKSFLQTYPESTSQIIDIENYQSFLCL